MYRLLIAVGLLTACQSPPARPAGASLTQGPLTLSDWRATNSVGQAGASLFGIVSSAEPDTLMGIDSDVADRISLHVTGSDGRMQEAGGRFVVGAGEQLVLRDRGPHAMMESLTRALEPGDSVDIILLFTQAGPVSLRIPVFRLTEASTERP